MRPIYNIGEAKTVKQPARNQTKLRDDEEEEDSNSGARWYLKSVRNLINVFEQKDREKNRPFRPNLIKTKSKSYANLRQATAATSYRTKDVVNRFETHKPKGSTAFPELDAIKSTAASLKSKITDSKIIDSKNCIVYQNQIIALLTKIGSLESNGNPLIKEEKQKCLKIVQGCNIALRNKIGEEEAATPMALASFVKSLKKFDNSNEPVSKVQMLRGIFEAKKDNGTVKPTKPEETKKQQKPPLVIDDQFTYTPYSEYLKRKNSEEIIGLSKLQDTSKSCENISTHDYSGIKRLLNRLNDKKRANSHHRAKSLTDIKVEEQNFSVASSTEEISGNSTGNISNCEEATEDAPVVKLVSVKPAEDAEIPVVVVREEEKADTPILNGDDGEMSSESDDEDSEADEHKHSSGFYSFVGDESFDDSFHDAEQDKEISDQVDIIGSNYYEPFSNVKCKMANGIVNITLNGVQVE